MNQIVLVGGGGHCSSVIDVIETQGNYMVAGIVDNVASLGSEVSGYKVIARDPDLGSLARQYRYALVTVGQLTSGRLRGELYKKLIDTNWHLPAIISPNAFCSKSAEVEAGSVIMHQTTLNSASHIGVNCIINSRAVIEHGVSIGSHCHISTGVIINGDTEVGEGTFVGSGSIVIQGLKIGKNVVIGAGSVIKKDVPDNSFIR